MNTKETKSLRKITLPTVWERTNRSVTTFTFLRYEKYFNEKGIEYAYVISDNPDNPFITYELNCTEEELLLIKLSL